VAGAGGFELRMAESKSSNFSSYINVNSENRRESPSNPINGLQCVSEWNRGVTLRPDIAEQKAPPSHKETPSSPAKQTYVVSGGVAHSLPRQGTLTMRLSIGNAPETARAISSACRREPPLELMPSSVTFSSVTDTETPSGAIERLMCSANAT
jgi:hypothetical protein